MTIVTVEMTSPVKTLFFDPPLPPAKEMQILNFCMTGEGIHAGKIYCDIVDPFSSYAKFERGSSLSPSQLLGSMYFFNSPYDLSKPKFPKVEVMKSRDPIREMKITFVGERYLPIRCRVPKLLVLKIYHETKK